MKRVPLRRVFHVRRGRPYHQANSRRGVLEAVRKGYRWIDLDVRTTSDGVLVVTHWPRPMIHDGFTDPLYRSVHRATPVERLTWSQVRRLRAPGGYRILRADRLLRFALDQGLNVELEIKSERVTLQQWQQLAISLADRLDRVQVKALNTNPPHASGAHVPLYRAHLAGFRTIILGRNQPAPASARAFIDYRRGRVRWIGGK